MKKFTALPVLAPYLAGFGMGFFAGRSWLNAGALVVGFLLVTVYWLIRTPVERRRKMRALRPQVEDLLDKMIALAAQPAAAMEKIVIFNESGREGFETRAHHLQLREPDGTRRILRSTVLEKGRRAGWLHVTLSVYRDNERLLGLEYPALGDLAPQEDWLTERLAKLRALVGDGSLYRKIKQRLKDHGIDPLAKPPEH